mmetsp:Transcript_42599/g.85285  ORF Transcript_42599/g.85285 Transcript_42599/m.85285 type:complete len:413 (+) Transcript_42599:44-1282(+)
MIVFKESKEIGHPYLIFGEKTSNIFKRWLDNNLQFNSNFENLFLKKNIYLKYNKMNFFPFSLVFSTFLKIELRKKKYQNGTWVLRKFFSSTLISNNLILKRGSFFSSRMRMKKNSFFEKSGFSKFKISFRQKGFFSTSCLFNSDNFLATGLTDGSLVVYKLGKRQPFYHFKNSRSKFIGIDSHPFFPSIICSSKEKITNVWKISNSIRKMQNYSILHDSAINISAFQKEGKSIDFGTLNQVWKSFDIQKQKWIFKHKFSQNISCISYHKWSCLVGIALSSQLILFDTRVRKSLFSLETDQKSILSMEWDKDNLRLFCSGTKKKGNFWDFRKINHRFQCFKHQDSIVSLSFHPVLNFLFSSSRDKTTKVWDGKTLKKVATFRDQKEKIKESYYTPNGIFFISLSKKLLLTYSF